MSDKLNSIEIQNLQDISPPFGVRLSAIYMRSFAYITLKDRLPVILTKAIDVMSRNKEEILQTYGENAMEEIKEMTGFISQLKNEIVTNKTLKVMPVIENDPNNDAPVWNKYLLDKIESEGATPTWFNTEWMYCENYMYRLLAQKLLLMNALRTYDLFGYQKRETFISSLNTTKFLAKYLKILADKVKSISEVEKKEEFFNFIKLNLWGNRCDLSLSTGSDINLIGNPIEQLESLKSYIIDDRTEFAWQLLNKQKQNDSVIVDLICDNAAYEFFTDLCLAVILIKFGFARTIRFYVKCHPWYVSDTTIHDFYWILEYMDTSSDPNLKWLAKLSYDYLRDKIFTVEEDSYWTGPYCFTEMKEKDKALYAKLSDAKLAIFKGDLNYRKLLGDINWVYTTPFIESLRGFRPTNILCLRTVKSDVCAGLSPGKAEKLFEEDQNWMISGQYGVIQATIDQGCHCNITGC